MGNSELFGTVVNVVQPDAPQLVILGDHASNHIPKTLNQLGLGEAALSDHVAYDIGTAPLIRRLSDSLNATGVLAGVSRLVLDLNRRLDQPGLIPERSDTYDIPGNQKLSAEDTAARINGIYDVYHRRVAEVVASKTAPIVLSIHSFTPQMDGKPRPWDCGLLWNRDDRLSRRAISFFQKEGLRVGENEPYPGHTYAATTDQHAEAHGHPYMMLEIRNDQLRDDAGIDLWAERVTRMMTAIDIANLDNTSRAH